MSYYLIGIGGTGARCMEAFVYLNGAGLLEDNQPVRLVYVDADVSCGNLQRTQKAVSSYEKARKIGFGACRVFGNAVEDSEVWDPVAEDCSNLDDVFKRVSLINRKETEGLGLLYDALFTEQERTTNLDKGFRGHPAIGAAVMNQTMNENISPWREVIPDINTDKDAKIFLFASVFGGTGAAGFPTIARLLKQVLKKDEAGECVAKIGGVLVLPYFQFPPADTESAQEMQAKVDEFMLNTKSALSYYNAMNLANDVFSKIYMVGDSDYSSVSRFSLGSGTQENEANIVELYAALAAFDFFNASEYTKGETPLIACGDDEKGLITWDDLPNVCANGKFYDKFTNYMRFLYAFKVGVLPSLRDIAKDQSAERRVAWYKDLLKGAGNIDVYNQRDVMAGFNELGNYADMFFEWLRNISSHQRRNISLVNPAIYENNMLSNNFDIDLYQVTLPISERKQKMKQLQFWQALSSYGKKAEKSTAGGAAILMQAVEDICALK